MAYNENGYTTNCGKPYAHPEHDAHLDDFYCDGALWKPVL